MSNALNLNTEGTYKGYPDLLEFYQRKAKETPKGVSLKLQNNKHLLLQFTFPDTRKRSTKTCGVQFTEKGVIEALDKAWKVKEALERFTTASEFWSWYDLEILGKNTLVNDLKTYREIFEEIEQEYWNGTHKNTGEKRKKGITNYDRSFFETYLKFFNKFNNWDKYPEWIDLELVLNSFEKGTKSYKDCYSTLKNIANRCNIKTSQLLIEKLNKIDSKQSIFKEKQSISIDEFLNWYKTCSDEIPTLNRQCDRETRQSWLWVCAMCVIYGLRPSEIMSAINLYKPVTEKEIKQAWGSKGSRLGASKVTIKAINDPTNTELLLVLGNQYYVGENNDIPITIKTGGRICTPLCNNNKIIELLKIHYPKLPAYTPKLNSKPESYITGFTANYRKRLLGYKCPVTQAYAFRHLGNQLGEKYGIPQETRARSLGHSVAMNDSTYKSRENLQTTVDLLTNYSKQPLGLDAAKFQLEASGFDLNDPSVKAMLKIIYQLDN
ncbi:recombinase [Planktothrix sp. FACHB-1365]|uniref:recombinase n=1 Tax=Planktothrix sp. FACHB-1365 TaxID=2692855 RepID=UPI001686744D|nr:recombinase [Planktothrix sp. FACHB-1365]MBD2481537.1 recombinase [Planktothrix sp. FACHB-1365]